MKWLALVVLVVYSCLIVYSLKCWDDFLNGR